MKRTPILLAKPVATRAYHAPVVQLSKEHFPGLHERREHGSCVSFVHHVLNSAKARGTARRRIKKITEAADSINISLLFNANPAPSLAAKIVKNMICNHRVSYTSKSSAAKFSVVRNFTASRIALMCLGHK
jgi:hypothetical protein